MYAICYVLQVTYLTMSVVGVHYWGQIILKLHLNCCAPEVSRDITLESVIDVGQGICVGPGRFGKKNKRRALN